jgi:hypothetical protein
MTERTFALFILLLAGGTWWTWGLVNAWRARRRLAGVRIVTCPETGRPAAVTFDRTHAAITAMVQDGPDVELCDCSRWNERGPCAQPCLADALPLETATDHIVAKWAES